MKGTRSVLPAVLVVGAAAAALGQPGSVVVPRAEVAFQDAGIPGVSAAAVDGKMASGPSHFYLRYAPGFVAPVHHHSPDHYVTTVSGTLVLIVEGKERRLAPGSFFALTGKAPHATRCEGSEDCVMFIDARGAWDVVPEPPAK
jgi:mannose-6-phosphate isomerase-like protein (cupin superfamily)